MKRLSVDKTPEKLLLPIICLVIGFGSGWLIHKGPSANASKLETLRLNGYKFVSPLLVCDNDPDKKSADLFGLESKIKDAVEKRKKDDRIVSASVYFRDFKTGNQLNVGGEETYYPASLNKVSVMMAYFKLAETDPGIIDKKITVNFPDDLNATQEIKPAMSAKNGSTYSVMELIELSLKYSDNMAATALVNNIDRSLLEKTFSDLNIPLPKDNGVDDYMKANDFSNFLRVLYNATYLNKDYSEKALQILSEVDFKEGLVAGVGKNVAVSHKFGLKTYLNNDGVAIGRELHDCGIVYRDKNPYLLCVMTKNRGNLSASKDTIKVISAIVFDEAARNYR